MNSIAKNILHIFNQKFSTLPKLYFSPGRINLIGEHVDYNDGFVMPAAIDKGIYFAVAANNSSSINFYAADYNQGFSAQISDIKKQANWENYVLSVVNEFLLLGKIIEGFDCVFAGDIPQGSGMSSSAAVEAGLAFALNNIFNTGLITLELALLCQRAEHNFPNVQCGIMDMYANLFGKKNQVILLDCKTLTHHYFPLKLAGYTIVLLNSKVHHSLASSEYNLRRQQCQEGLMIMGLDSAVQSFRDIKKWEVVLDYESQMSEEVFMRCMYVVQEIDRTKQAALLLQQNNLVGFGKLMYETHSGLSKLYNVSCKELDFLVHVASQNENVIGARLMGGGFGGSTINIVKENAVADFIDHATKNYFQQFNISLESYIVEIGEGTREILH